MIIAINTAMLFAVILAMIVAVIFVVMFAMSDHRYLGWQIDRNGDRYRFEMIQRAATGWLSVCVNGGAGSHDASNTTFGRSQFSKIL